MTLEQFEKAQEISAEMRLVIDVENLLVNWKMTDRHPNIIAVIHGPNSYNSGEICNEVHECSKELQDKLIQTCRDYYSELNKKFAEI